MLVASDGGDEEAKGVTLVLKRKRARESTHLGEEEPRASDRRGELPVSAAAVERQKRRGNEKLSFVPPREQ